MKFNSPISRHFYSSKISFIDGSSIVSRTVSFSGFSTISTMPGLEGQPFNNVYSYSEGISGDSNGDLYFFVSGKLLIPATI